jgi:hypothetical protein
VEIEGIGGKQRDERESTQVYTEMHWQHAVSDAARVPTCLAEAYACVCMCLSIGVYLCVCLSVCVCLCGVCVCHMSVHLPMCVCLSVCVRTADACEEVHGGLIVWHFCIKASQVELVGNVVIVHLAKVLVSYAHSHAGHGQSG